MEKPDAIFIVRIDPSKKDQFPAEMLSMVADELKALGIRVKAHTKGMIGFAAMLYCTGRDSEIIIGMYPLSKPVDASSFKGHFVSMERERFFLSRLLSSLPKTSLNEVTGVISKVLDRDSGITRLVWVNEEDQDEKYAELKRQTLDRGKSEGSVGS